MTVVEFFDKSPIENMMSTLTGNVDRVIFVGDPEQMKAKEGHYRRFLEFTGLEVELEFRGVNENSLGDLIDVLCQIAEEDEEKREVSFDLTGGSDLALVAIGMVYERYRDLEIQLHRYDISTGEIRDCDEDGLVFSLAAPELTVEENIALYGGSVLTQEDTPDGTVLWDFSEEFQEDLDRMWGICALNCGTWNFYALVLGTLGSRFDEGDCFCARHSAVEAVRREQGWDLDLMGFLNRLAREGLIRRLEDDGERISFRYKNSQVKRCLQKGGTILELKTYLAAMQARRETEDGEPQFLFNDGMTGVFIDWDGVRFAGGTDTENEVDVILMRGVIPIFISCKNGKVEKDELYKLNTVAERFGGPYAKKVLVVTTYGKSASAREMLVERARDMGILVIDNVQAMSDRAFRERIAALAE